MPSNRFNAFTNYGIGIGLRIPHYDHIFEKQPVVDWFEIISENYMVDGGRPLATLDRILERYRVVQHGVSMYFGSAEPLNKGHLRRLKALVKRTRTPWLSDHLCWGSVDGTYSHDLLPMPYTFEAAKITARKMREARDFLEVPIAVENVSSYAEFHMSEMTEWEFLTEVVEQADCGILLDVNNIYVSSRNHDFDPYEYLNSIPAERVAQIHIAGHSKFQKYILDTHDHPVIDPVWKMYEHAIRRIGPTATLLEWDDRIPSFDEVHAEALKAEKYIQAPALVTVMTLLEVQTRMANAIFQPLTKLRSNGSWNRCRLHQAQRSSDFGGTPRNLQPQLLVPHSRFALRGLSRVARRGRGADFPPTLARLSRRMPVAIVHAAQPGFASCGVVASEIRSMPEAAMRWRSIWCASNGRISKRSTMPPKRYLALRICWNSVLTSARALQPYIRLLALQYPVDDLRIQVNHGSDEAWRCKQCGTQAEASQYDPSRAARSKARADLPCGPSAG